MINIEICPLRPEHSAIAVHLRKSDLDEINALNGLPPDVAVAFSIINSEKGAAVFLDGRLCAIFGIAKGVIWLVGSDEITNHPVTFFRLSKQIFHGLRKGYTYLENYVDTRNKLSLRWLAWLGFHIEPSSALGGGFFHHVWWKEDASCVH